MSFPKGSTLKDRFDWVTKAMSKDPCRAILNAILIEDDTPFNPNDEITAGCKRIVATDGRRLHVARFDAKQSEELPDNGIYQVNKVNGCGWMLTNISGTGSYPNYRQVIPEDIETTKKMGLGSWKKQFEFNVFTIFKATGRCFNIAYMRDSYDAGKWVIRTNGDTTNTLKSVNEDNGDTHILMCLRID